MLLDTDDCILWPYGQSHGYGRINVEVDGKKRAVHVHTLACERAHGPAPAGQEACHGPCHSRLCFNGRHLSWGTRQSNVDDRERDGTNPKGVLHGQAVLSDDDVREIRRLRSLGVRGVDVAARFGVAEQTVCNIVKGRRWTHVS